MKKIQTMDGNQAAAYASYALTEIASIFPITPSTPMAELVDEWSAHEKKNIFGQKVKVIEMQFPCRENWRRKSFRRGVPQYLLLWQGQARFLLFSGLWRFHGNTAGRSVSFPRRDAEISFPTNLTRRKSRKPLKP